MFKPSVELRKTVDSELKTILTKEIEIPERGFPEVIIYKDECFSIVDWEPNVHAVYDFSTSIILRYEPKITT